MIDHATESNKTARRLLIEAFQSMGSIYRPSGLDDIYGDVKLMIVPRIMMHRTYVRLVRLWGTQILVALQR